MAEFAAEIRDTSRHDIKIWLGTLDSAEVATLAYDQAAFSMCGSIVVLNFPVEHVRRSLRYMKYDCDDGCSPVVALKKRHSMSKKNKGRQVQIESVVGLEDLGTEYLEQLLSSFESTSPC